jgi:hypothetical protein
MSRAITSQYVAAYGGGGGGGGWNGDPLNQFAMMADTLGTIWAGAYSDTGSYYNSCVTTDYTNPVEVKLPEQMYCNYCWSEWNDADFHPGTCTNCGAPKYKACKPESEMRWSYEYEMDDDDEADV